MSEQIQNSRIPFDFNKDGKYDNKDREKVLQLVEQLIGQGFDTDQPININDLRNIDITGEGIVTAEDFAIIQEIAAADTQGQDDFLTSRDLRDMARQDGLVINGDAVHQNTYAEAFFNKLADAMDAKDVSVLRPAGTVGIDQLLTSAGNEDQLSKINSFTSIPFHNIHFPFPGIPIGEPLLAVKNEQAVEGPFGNLVPETAIEVTAFNNNAPPYGVIIENIKISVGGHTIEISAHNNTIKLNGQTVNIGSEGINAVRNLLNQLPDPKPFVDYTHGPGGFNFHLNWTNPRTGEQIIVNMSPNMFSQGINLDYNPSTGNVLSGLLADRTAGGNTDYNDFNVNNDPSLLEVDAVIISEDVVETNTTVQIDDRIANLIDELNDFDAENKPAEFAEFLERVSNEIVAIQTEIANFSQENKDTLEASIKGLSTALVNEIFEFTGNPNIDPAHTSRAQIVLDALRSIDPIGIGTIELGADVDNYLSDIDAEIDQLEAQQLANSISGAITGNTGTSLQAQIAFLRKQKAFLSTIKVSLSNANITDINELNIIKADVAQLETLKDNYVAVQNANPSDPNLGNISDSIDNLVFNTLVTLNGTGTANAPIFNQITTTGNDIAAKLLVTEQQIADLQVQLQAAANDPDIDADLIQAQINGLNNVKSFYDSYSSMLTDVSLLVTQVDLGNDASELNQFLTLNAQAVDAIMTEYGKLLADPSMSNERISQLVNNAYKRSFNEIRRIINDNLPGAAMPGLPDARIFFNASTSRRAGSSGGVGGSSGSSSSRRRRGRGRRAGGTGTTGGTNPTTGAGTGGSNPTNPTGGTGTTPPADPNAGGGNTSNPPPSTPPTRSRTRFSSTRRRRRVRASSTRRNRSGTSTSRLTVDPGVTRVDQTSTQRRRRR